MTFSGDEFDVAPPHESAAFCGSDSHAILPVFKLKTWLIRSSFVQKTPTYGSLEKQAQPDCVSAVIIERYFVHSLSFGAQNLSLYSQEP